MTTSVAELLKRIYSLLGTMDWSRSATSISNSDWAAQCVPSFALLRDGIRHALRSMAEKQRALADLEIDVVVAIHVPQTGTLARVRNKAERVCSICECRC